MTSLLRDGYEIHRGVFTGAEIERFREEANQVASQADSACVRHLNNRSSLFHRLSHSSRLLALFPHLSQSAVRSILFDKTPDENWPVAWHQDLTIAVESRIDCDGYEPWSVKDGIPHVQAPVRLLEEMVTARIHLDPTGADNGALMVLPGSHRLGRLSSESIRKFDDNSAITCECQPGDVLLMSPLILHSSRRSHHPSRRRIIHFEYAPPDALDSRLTWHETHSSIRGN